MRFCVDYRRLNHVTKLDEFPQMVSQMVKFFYSYAHRIDDTLDLLAGTKYFTTLDLASGYWQVPMDRASQEKTAFTTYSGLYEFRKMPFGLVNAPATFQHLMEVVLTGLARGSCHVYLDDVLVLGKTLEEHLTNLTKVFSRIRGAGLRLKPKMCDFAQESVEYLGHVVSAEGIQTDPEKLRAVNRYPTPTDVKPLRSFLGLASYYRCFVPGLSKIAAPLNALTRKDVALNLTIEHRSGKHNANADADALSRYPLPDSTDGTPTEELVAALTTVGGDSSVEESTLATLQKEDIELAPMMDYLKTGTLPQNDKEARWIVLSSGQYTLEDGILYRVEDDWTLRVVPPVGQRERLFLEAHGEKFGAHLSDAKVYSEIRRHYRWVGMRRDITRWTRGCIVCATRSVGRAVRPPLTPIPVTRPFDRIGVDVIQFPKTSRGNQYAVVFVDYLTKWPEVFAVPDQSAATIARLLVEEIVSRHGVPSEVLSDRGRAFLSGLMQEAERLLGFKKGNTTAYHM